MGDKPPQQRKARPPVTPHQSAAVAWALALVLFVVAIYYYQSRDIRTAALVSFAAAISIGIGFRRYGRQEDTDKTAIVAKNEGQAGAW